MPRYVEYGSGSLGEVISETPRDNRRPKGVNILPLNTGSGDSFGRGTIWYPETHVKQADMTTWGYDPSRNLFTKRKDHG